MLFVCLLYDKPGQALAKLCLRCVRLCWSDRCYVPCCVIFHLVNNNMGLFLEILSYLSCMLIFTMVLDYILNLQNILNNHHNNKVKTNVTQSGDSAQYCAVVEKTIWPFVHQTLKHDTKVLFPCLSRRSSSCDVSVAICLPFSVLVLFFSSAVEELSVHLSLCLFFCGGGAVCLPLYLSTCLCVCSSSVVEEQSVYLSTCLFFFCGGAVCLPVYLSLYLFFCGGGAVCLPVYLSLCLFFFCGGGAVWWRLTMCCVSSLQSSQGGGHRTLLYGHAILLRHYHSSMVRTHSSSSRIPGGQTLNDPILTFQSKPDSKMGSLSDLHNQSGFFFYTGIICKFSVNLLS